MVIILIQLCSIVIKKNENININNTMTELADTINNYIDKDSTYVVMTYLILSDHYVHRLSIEHRRYEYRYTNILHMYKHMPIYIPGLLLFELKRSGIVHKMNDRRTRVIINNICIEACNRGDYPVVKYIAPHMKSDMRSCLLSVYEHEDKQLYNILTSFDNFKQCSDFINICKQKLNIG